MLQKIIDFVKELKKANCDHKNTEIGVIKTIHTTDDLNRPKTEYQCKVCGSNITLDFK